MKLFRRFIEKMCPTLEFSEAEFVKRKKNKKQKTKRAPVKV